MAVRWLLALLFLLLTMCAGIAALCKKGDKIYKILTLLLGTLAFLVAVLPQEALNNPTRPYTPQASPNTPAPSLSLDPLHSPALTPKTAATPRLSPSPTPFETVQAGEANDTTPLLLTDCSSHGHVQDAEALDGYIIKYKTGAGWQAERFQVSAKAFVADETDAALHHVYVTFAGAPITGMVLDISMPGSYADLQLQADYDGCGVELYLSEGAFLFHAVKMDGPLIKHYATGKVHIDKCGAYTVEMKRV